MKFRSKPVVIEAALYDGKLVGDGVQVGQSAEWRVTPRTCPEWFPTPNEVVPEEPTALEPGTVVKQGSDLFLGSIHGTLRAEPGDWLVLEARRLSVLKPDEFHAKYEPV